MKHYTSIEQSKKLLELGLNPETADMFYDGIQDLYKEKVYNIPENGSSITIRIGHTITERGIKNNLLLPCWSLGALLNLMPDILFTKEKNMYYFGHPDSNHIEQNTSSIIAAYSMICWLLENNYIEK